MSPEKIIPCIFRVMRYARCPGQGENGSHRGLP
jgi:hypothetical protein